MKSKCSVLTFVVFLSLQAKAQVGDYHYQRTVATPTDTWHQINLPLDVFNSLNSNLSDIRIYGISNQQDTLEVPYMVKRYEEEIVRKDIAFTLLNQSRNESGYYFTFEVPVAGLVNQIFLNFSNKNFDWRVTLQGSHDLQEWFTLVDDYRILSIQNASTNFSFSTLNFPDARFKYFRVLLPLRDTPNLMSASLFYNTIEPGKSVEYTSEFTVSQNKVAHKTTIEVDLKSKLPVNTIQVKPVDAFDFYRPYTIQYLSDSFKTERGWHYTYATLATGILNSLEQTPIQFESTLAAKLRIVIENQDNQPLTIDSVLISGVEHALLARFTEKADYFLVYGNKRARLPAYDIGHFTEAIPTDLKLLEVGNNADPILIGPLDEYEIASPNQLWLWLTLIVVAAALGWFSIKMLKKTN